MSTRPSPKMFDRLFFYFVISTRTLTDLIVALVSESKDIWVRGADDVCGENFEMKTVG